MKVSELRGSLLDYWVGRASGVEKLRSSGQWTQVLDMTYGFGGGVWSHYSPSTNWGIAGPIIEHAGIYLLNHYDQANADASLTWTAEIRGSEPFEGPTPLVAAMRAYVSSKFGGEVGDVPISDRAPIGVMR